MIIIAVETQDKTFGVFTRGTDHPVSLGTLRSDDGDGNENFKKAIELITKKTILHVHHAFLLISLPSLHDYDVKMPYFTIHRLKYQATTKFSPFFELGYGS